MLRRPAAPDHAAGRRRRHTRRDGDHRAHRRTRPDVEPGGLGTLVRMWQTLLSRGRGMGLCD